MVRGRWKGRKGAREGIERERERARRREGRIDERGEREVTREGEGGVEGDRGEEPREREGQVQRHPEKKHADAKFSQKKAQFSPLEEINLLPLLFLTRE